jgi:gas vesicle protein
VARQDNGGFLAGLVVGGLVGAAVALLATPRGGQLARQAISGLGMENPEALLDRSRDTLRARFQQAATEAQQAATDTERRLESEYRGGSDGA